MVPKAPIFEAIRKDYLRQVANLDDRERRCEALGLSMREDAVLIPFFNRLYTLTPHGILDDHGKSANHLTSVVLCQYLLLYSGQTTGDAALVTYKDFKDAAPYTGGFKNTAEHPIASHFEGALPALENQCRKLDGRPFNTDVLCQFAFQFKALPRVPVFLLFNDADEDFPAQATLLYRKDAQAYLDMECIAMVGSTLAAWLKGNRLDYM